MDIKKFIAASRNGKAKNKQPMLDLRNIGTVGMSPPKPIVVTKESWAVIKTRCSELNDDEFHVDRVYKRCVEFTLKDHDGKPQEYQIRAEPLKRTERASGKKLLALFLTFEKEGTLVVDTSPFWFEPFKLWLKYWAGNGLNPKEAKRGLDTVSRAVNIGKV